MHMLASQKRQTSLSRCVLRPIFEPLLGYLCVFLLHVFGNFPYVVCFGLPKMLSSSILFLVCLHYTTNYASFVYRTSNEAFKVSANRILLSVTFLFFTYINNESAREYKC